MKYIMQGQGKRQIHNQTMKQYTLSILTAIFQVYLG